ncbi:MAG: polyhydroxyalkanoic acid system family protein [Myxococcota bacterium]
MADVQIKREHGLDHSEAKDRIKAIVDDLEQNLDLLDTVDWTSDSYAKISGKGFKGHFEVDEDNVNVEIDLKFFAKPFKGKVQEKIASRMDKHFG